MNLVKFDNPSVCINTDKIAYVVPGNSPDSTIIFIDDGIRLRINDSYEHVTDKLQSTLQNRYISLTGGHGYGTSSN